MKNIIRSLICMTFVGACGGAVAAVPADLITAGYEVYASSVDSDGCQDYLVKAPNTWAMLSIDDDMPLIIPAPSRHRPFILTATFSWATHICSYTLLNNPSPLQISDSSRGWVRTNVRIAVGDVLGNSSGSLLIGPIQASNDTQAIEQSLSFNVARNASGVFSLIQKLPGVSFAVGVDQAVLTLEYSDNDQRSDLVVRVAGQITNIYAANADGTFSASSDTNKVAAATAVWNNFIGQLRSGTVAQVLQSISAQTRDRFQTMLALPGANLPAFANAITRFEVIDITDVVVKAAIIIPSNGVDMMYFVVFGKDADGTWKIYSM